MKKFILLICIYVLPFAFLQAKTVNFEKAEQAATTFIAPAKSSGMSTAAVNLALVKTATAESNYYVFNKEDGGFVIVSGDDAAKPVLGYSDKDSFDENNLPPALEYWLDCLNKEIEYAAENNFPSNAEWESASSIGTAAVSHLVQTTWNQTPPYNGQCPLISGTRPYTGCVATAMAQIMKYWAYPAQGTGSTESYTATNGNITVPVVDLAVNYVWTDMINNYPSGSSGTATQRDAVAKLMYHCGASVQMNYGLDGSSASVRNVATSLLNHYDYDQSISYKMREYYSSTEWENILMQQIDAGLPVLYSGSNPQSGHAFICDGYDDTGKFHFNWGWGGSKDGYFVTTALNPGSGGAGSGAGTYNEAQYILINMKPNEGGAPTDEVIMWSETDMSSATTQIARNTSFSVTTSIISKGFFPFSGYLGIALVDNDNHILAILGKTTWKLNLNGNGYTSLDISNLKVPTTIPTGNYKMKSVAITETDTVILRATTGYTGELPLTVIQPATGVSLDKSTITLGIDGTSVLTETVLPEDATNKAVIWLSDNEDIATVINGLVTATGVGTATITVKTADGNFTANCTVTVKSGVSTVTLNPAGGILSGENTFTETSVGSGVELPEASPCNSEWTFAGWSLNKITELTELEDENDVAASLIPAGLYAPQNDITLFAVYKKYVNNGEKEKVILFENFNGSYSGWSAPGTYYPNSGIDGSKTLTYPSVGDAIISPKVTNASSVSFYISRINTGSYNSTIMFNVEVQQDNSPAWETVESYVSPNRNSIITGSLVKKTVQLNLTGIYKIRFYLASADAEFSSHLILDDVTIYSTYIDEGNVYISNANCDVITSTSETTHSKLSVSPNPAENEVQISGEKVLSVQIKDLSGRLVKESNKNVVSIKDLQSGIYLFVIQTEDEIITKKIVKK
jgi:uncharacterized protein YjdB